MNRLYSRGNRTQELPFLMSCAVFLLDRRFWILGIRFPQQEPRFDIVAKNTADINHVFLVEGKYRGDGRPVRPYEVKEFQSQIENERRLVPGALIFGIFMTNSGFSQKAIDLARKHRIRMFPNVPILLQSMEERKGKE